MTVVGSITIPGRPVSLNAERAANRFKRAELTKATRLMAQLLWRSGVAEGELPKSLDRIAVTAQVTAKDRRWRQDIAACIPAVKAAIDGIVDAGLLPNDTDRHLVRLTFEPTEITGRDGLVLTVIDMGEPT